MIFEVGFGGTDVMFTNDIILLQCILIMHALMLSELVTMAVIGMVIIVVHCTG